MKHHPGHCEADLSRRRICATGAIALAFPMLLLPRRVRASSAVRSLAFSHTHTGEALTVPYAQGETYFPDALRALDHLLRDFRTGETHSIEPRLFDQLHDLATITSTRAPFQVISGYRSETTNRELREASRGVASHSLHLEGRAIDIRLADVKLDDLRDAALSLKAGGVGYYPGSAFVHVDTGRVRRW
jgi:uncharacterized protein YcbK (DUF882 family)